MKKNILINGLAALAMMGLGTSCASDYLDLAPETTVSSSMVYTTIEGAEGAMIGAYRSMYKQYTAWEANNGFVQGEASIATFYGDALGVDAYYQFWGRYGVRMLNWSAINDKLTWIPSLAWMYSYNLINQCNEILYGIDTMESGTEARRQRVKAQALALRAHAYVRLLQLYAPRWADSADGSKLVCVLRTTPGTGDIPLSTHKEVLDQIYSDLETSIELFDACGIQRSANYEINKEVAEGIFARAALLKNDWQTAYDMSKAARAGFPIMSAEAYQAGFVDETSESMWNNTLDETWIYYWSWGSLYSTVGAYSTYGAPFGAGLMSYDLYKQMDAKDCRRNLYFMPDKPLRRPLDASAFWNKSIVDPLTMNLNTNANMRISVRAFGKAQNPDPVRFRNPYTNEDGSDSDDVMIQFGAQYKFYGVGNYALSCFPFMRSSEMLLYQAEAAYRLGQEGEAQQLLTELNSQRIEGYTCTSSGEDLMNEIMLTSRVELWGEGHAWFNAKRWNITVERNVWVEGDMNSNNIPSKFKMVKTPSDNRGWVFTIPNGELQYNHAIDPNQVLGLSTEVWVDPDEDEEE